MLAVDVNDRRFFVEARANGEWLFVPPAPLATGTTLVRVVEVDVSGRPRGDESSVMLSIGVDAQAVAPPSLRTAPSDAFAAPSPSLRGSGPAGMRLVIFVQSEGNLEPVQLAEVRIDGSGRWSVQPGVLSAGDYILWLVTYNENGTPISRSATYAFSVEL